MLRWHFHKTSRAKTPFGSDTMSNHEVRHCVFCTYKHASPPTFHARTHTQTHLLPGTMPMRRNKTQLLVGSSGWNKTVSFSSIQTLGISPKTLSCAHTHTHGQHLACISTAVCTQSLTLTHYVHTYMHAPQVHTHTFTVAHTIYVRPWKGMCDV